MSIESRVFAGDFCHKRTFVIYTPAGTQDEINASVLYGASNAYGAPMAVIRIDPTDAKSFELPSIMEVDASTLREYK